MRSQIGFKSNTAAMSGRKSQPPAIRGHYRRTRGARMSVPSSYGFNFNGGLETVQRFHNDGFNRFVSEYSDEDQNSNTDGSDVEVLDDGEIVDDGIIDIENETFLGSMRGEIVGLRYYTGEITRGELVQLVREPQNKYDKNAVRVDNSLGDQVGHIKREIAAALAAVMDKKLARIEGRCPTNKNTFSMSVDLSFYGRAENGPKVKGIMAKEGYKLSDTEIARGHASYNTQLEAGEKSADEKALAEFSYTSVMKAVNSEELNKELDKMFETLREEDKFLYAEPAKTVATPLFLHQKQALAWMMNRENNDDLPPFWEQLKTSAKRTVYKNVLTGIITDRRPEILRGGMLADDMGLGKTLQIIALIATNGPDGKPLKLRTDAVVKAKRPSASSRPSSASVKRRLVNTTPRTPAAVSAAGSPRQLSDRCLRMFKILDEANERARTASGGSANVTTNGSTKPKSGVITVDDDGDDDKPSTSKKSTATKRKLESGPPERSAKAIRSRIDSDDSDYEFFSGGSPSSKSKGTSKDASKPSANTNGDVDWTIDDDFELPPTDDPGFLDESPDKGEQSDLDFEFETAADFSKEPRPTLIICPMSVMQNWEDQLEQHIDPAAFRYLNIHRQYGSNLLSASQLKKMDVVITTYQTMTSAWKRKRDPLFQVEWLRIVLDEGHIIRNPSAQMAIAACELKARRRWVLTGTPIQNRLLDLWSIVRFLRVKPLDQRVFWRQCIERPISSKSVYGFKCIRALMKAMTMRRTKTQEIEPGKPLVSLPPRIMMQDTMNFSDDERALYDTMLAEGRLIVNRYIEEGTFMHNYAHVLAILMRLRQLCCHPYLVRKAAQRAKELGLVAADDGALAALGAAGKEARNRDLAQMLLQLVTSTDANGCPICFETPPIQAVMNPACKHYYCRECINDWIRVRPDAKCPMCRGVLEPNRFVEAPSKDDSNGKDSEDDWQSSVKVDAVMSHLLRLRQEDPTIKSIVVSQFTSFLDVIEKPLMKAGFIFTRLDGTMTAADRADAVREFQDKSPESPTIFLLSLKAGGVGINLTAATKVFLMDPAWNPASEEQCFDRCHRLGQTKDVTIVKFIVGNTIEERMLELQERKRLLMTEAFGGPKKKRDEKELINQVRVLLS